MERVERRFTLREYLGLPETNRPQELAYGILREPPSPFYPHQAVLGRLHLPIVRHVQRYRLGEVVLAPMDVILDPEHALVVQPDLLFVSEARRAIISNQIWGSPDLTVEVLSDTRRRHDRVVKLGWYRQYGVLECWLVDPDTERVEVVDLTSAAHASRTFAGRQIVRSAVLPRLRLRAVDVFYGRGTNL